MPAISDNRSTAVCRFTRRPPASLPDESPPSLEAICTFSVRICSVRLLISSAIAVTRWSSCSCTSATRLVQIVDVLRERDALADRQVSRCGVARILQHLVDRVEEARQRAAQVPGIGQLIEQRFHFAVNLLLHLGIRPVAVRADQPRLHELVDLLDDAVDLDAQAEDQIALLLDAGRHVTRLPAARSRACWRWRYCCPPPAGRFASPAACCRPSESSRKDSCATARRDAGQNSGVVEQWSSGVADQLRLLHYSSTPLLLYPLPPTRPDRPAHRWPRRPSLYHMSALADRR